MHNSGQWTPARFHSFIKGGLRQISNRWPPKYEAKRLARRARGIYLCAGYKRRAHKVDVSLPPKPGGRKRINNVYVDHILPIVCPEKGFVSWDELVSRLFCELEGLQVLCKECHDNKTQTEREIRKKNKCTVLSK